jgi:hypothetical protein
MMMYRFVMHVWVDQASDMLQELIDENSQRLGEDSRNLVQAVSFCHNHTLSPHHLVHHLPYPAGARLHFIELEYGLHA